MNEPLNINPPKRMQNAGVLALTMLSIFLLFQTIGTIKSNSNIGVEPGQNIISVSGKGEVYATADIANFSFGVLGEGSTVAEAQKKATEINNKAIKMLKDGGVDEKDIKTTGYDVGPKYSYETKPCTQYSCPPSESKIVGYQVNQSISVKVRNIDKAGELLSNLGETGVSNISSLQFTIDDEDSLKDQARTVAIEDARKKAEKLAKDLDVSLGSVLSFSESNDAYPMYYSAKADMAPGVTGSAAPAPDLEKGQNKVTVNVNVTYRIR